MTIAECLYLISVVSKKYDSLVGELEYSYVEPLSLNGKGLPKSEKGEKMLDALAEIEVLSKDLLSLRSALQKANASLVFDGESLGEKLERVKLKRGLLDALSTALASGAVRTEAESGVGLVSYGLANEAKLKAQKEALEKEVNSLSLFIDRVNAETDLEVSLLGSY